MDSDSEDEDTKLKTRSSVEITSPKDK